MKHISPKNYLKPTAILSVIFVLIALCLQVNAVVFYDGLLGEYAYQFTDANLFFITLSEIGSRKFFYPALVLISILIAWKRKWEIVCLLWINLLGVRLTNTALKAVFGRQRPTLDHIVEAGYYSFPSGHSMNSMAFFGIFALLSYHFIKNKGAKRLIMACCSLLILLIGLSRVYLGVHYPLDVVAGFIAGSAWLFGVYGMFAFYLKWKEMKNHRRHKSFG